MADKTAQEQYTEARKSLIEVGQHGIAWAFDKAWTALRQENRDETAKALNQLQASHDREIIEPLTDDVIPYEPIDVPVIIEEKDLLPPRPGQDGAGGGASSQAGVEDKGPLPGGVIA